MSCEQTYTRTRFTLRCFSFHLLPDYWEDEDREREETLVPRCFLPPVSTCRHMFLFPLNGVQLMRPGALLRNGFHSPKKNLLVWIFQDANINSSSNNQLIYGYTLKSCPIVTDWSNTVKYVCLTQAAYTRSFYPLFDSNIGSLWHFLIRLPTMLPNSLIRHSMGKNTNQDISKNVDSQNARDKLFSLETGRPTHYDKRNLFS